MFLPQLVPSRVQMNDEDHYHHNHHYQLLGSSVRQSDQSPADAFFFHWSYSHHITHEFSSHTSIVSCGCCCCSGGGRVYSQVVLSTHSLIK